MEYNVYLNEFLDNIGRDKIETIKKNSGKALINFHGALIFELGTRSVGIPCILLALDENEKIKAVQLYVGADEYTVKEMWTKIYNEGFFNLDLYPMLYDCGSVTTLSLAPIKIPNYL